MPGNVGSRCFWNRDSNKKKVRQFHGPNRGQIEIPWFRWCIRIWNQADGNILTPEKQIEIKSYSAKVGLPNKDLPEKKIFVPSYNEKQNQERLVQ